MITLEKVRQRAELDARAHGYRLSPDPEFLQALIEGLKVNEERYGYPSCPCRLATGVFEVDRDIICPCDYRDLDVEEFGACYCCLYVDEATYESGEIRSISSPVNSATSFIKINSRTTSSVLNTVSSANRLKAAPAGHIATAALWHTARTQGR